MPRLTMLCIGALCFFDPHEPTVVPAEPPTACLAGEPDPQGRLPQGHPRSARDGTLRVLTYNIAGLPPGIGRHATPSGMRYIGSLLSRFDLTLVQEDFWYHDALVSGISGFMHRSKPHPAILGDGLNRFSRLPVGRVERHAWTKCHGVLSNGTDCLAPKGFSVGEVELAPSIRVDVYNLHMDADQYPPDRRTRIRQAHQLADRILDGSSDRAVIVAGDFNEHVPQEGALRVLEERAGLDDALLSLDPDDHRVDRVLYRSSPDLELRPVGMNVERKCFRRTDGSDLSDHEPVTVDFRWRALDHPDVASALDDADYRPPSTTSMARPRATTR